MSSCSFEVKTLVLSEIVCNWYTFLFCAYSSHYVHTSRCDCLYLLFCLFFFFRRWLFWEIIFLFEVFDPGMVENFDQRKAFICLIDKNFVNKVFIFIGKTRLKSYLPSHNFITNFTRMDSSKRCSSMHKFIKQDSQRPYIQSMIVVFILNHFRSHVF